MCPEMHEPLHFQSQLNLTLEGCCGHQGCLMDGKEFFYVGKNGDVHPWNLV